MTSSSASSRSLLRRASEASSLSRPCASFGLLEDGEALGVPRTARVDDGDVGLDARELGPQIVAGAEARRELLRELLAAGEQLLHAPRLRRVPAGVIRLADAGVELGDLDEATLIGGAGVHASQPTVAIDAGAGGH